MDGGNCMGLEAKDAMVLTGAQLAQVLSSFYMDIVWPLGAVTPTEPAENPGFP